MNRRSPHVTPPADSGDVTATVFAQFGEVAVPDHATDAAWVMRGEISDMSGPHIFLVHPTAHPSPAEEGELGWFADPAQAPVRAEAERVVRSQVTAFPGRVWAPHYRQATTRAFHERSRGGESAYDLAYDDVANAFSQFLVDDARIPGPRRPLVLVGHSQGARHLRTLMHEFFDHAGLAERLVATYVVGVAVPGDEPLLRHFPLARRPDDHGVIVTYQARLAPDGHTDLTRDGAQEPEAEAASASAPGGVATPGVVVPPSALAAPGLGRADGYLTIPRSRAAHLADAALPDGRLHHVEIEVVADLLAADVRRRTRAWRASQAIGVFEPLPADVTDPRVALPVAGRSIAVESWPGTWGQVLRVPDGLAHVVDLPGPLDDSAAGEQTPVVLLHKLGGWVAEWRGVATELAAHRRVVLVDLPGHGASAQEGQAPWIHWPQESARTVRAVLDTLGVDRAHFMGCSLGGVVSTWIAATQPDRVATLTLLGASVTPALSAARTLGIDRSVRAGFGRGWTPRAGSSTRAATSNAEVLAEQNASRARAGRWVRPSERGVGLAGVEHLLGRIEAPVLYLNGERAGYRSYEEKVREAIADVRVEVVPGVGAFAHQEAPEATAAIWEAFVGDRP